jgi:hypothetical protein
MLQNVHDPGTEIVVAWSSYVHNCPQYVLCVDSSNLKKGVSSVAMTGWLETCGMAFRSHKQPPVTCVVDSSQHKRP